MIRALIALLLIAATVFAVVFFADHPGQVEIVWQGRQIDTSVGVLVGVIALTALFTASLALLLAMLRRLPRNWRRRRAARRRSAGEAALTRGLVALAAGQPAEAQAQARRVESLLGAVPMGLLLAAEAAQRQGDAAGARHAYTVLLDRPETEFLGLRGLLGQALRSGDDLAALGLAERARRLRPDAPWLVESLLVLEARAGNWEAARQTLAGAARRGILPTDRARHHRGVILYQLSRAAEQQGELRRAMTLAGKAQALAPDLPAPAYDRARLQIVLGKKRAAAKTIERAWRTAPHPDLARLYLGIDGEAEPLARAATLLRLAERNPDAAESHIAIAEAALTAQLWGEARRHLALAAAAAAPHGPSRQLCLLMARLEESETGNGATARDWLDRAIAAPPDPCYVCAGCGDRSAAWSALCRQCGELDMLRWQRPADDYQPLAAPVANTALAPPMLPAGAVSGKDGGGRFAVRLGGDGAIG